MKTLRPSRLQAAGFTLVEIMIVVLIIGILLAIAVPNFVNARESGRAKACVANLKQIDSATQQYCMDNKVGGGGATGVMPTMAQLVGTNNTGYIRVTPACPSGGTYAVAATISTLPSCTITGAAGSGYESGAKWWHGIN